jgi:4'-phosphopantetheinyl transferase
VPLTSLPSGQPVLAGGAFSTSLSHSGSWVAIAVADAQTVGVDIECSPPKRPLAELLDTICTPDEATRMRRLPEARWEAALLALWVRKEALLKAFGTGLLEAPCSFEAWTDQPVAPHSASGLPACTVTELALKPSLVGALAVPAGVRVRQFVLDAFLSGD